MPSVSDAIASDTSGYTPTSDTSSQVSGVPGSDLQPTYNTMMRCPLPPIFAATPDSLRQFYVGGKVPQTRLLSVPTGNSTSGGGAGGNSVSDVGFVTNNSSTVINNGGTSPLGQQAVLVSATLNPGDRFTGVVNIAKCFQLLGLNASSPARVQIYGTVAARSSDLYRGIDQPLPAGTVQNVVCDIVLDTSPCQWSFQNRCGVNGDSPQNPLAYMTITNIGSATTPITVNIQYVPVES